jgi:hypothetical protein
VAPTHFGLEEIPVNVRPRLALSFTGTDNLFVDGEEGGARASATGVEQRSNRLFVTLWNITLFHVKFVHVNLTTEERKSDSGEWSEVTVKHDE